MMKVIKKLSTTKILIITCVLIISAIFINYVFFKNSVRLVFGTVKSVEWDEDAKHCHVELFGGTGFIFLENYEDEILVNKSYTFGVVRGLFYDRLVGYDTHN